MNKTSGVTEGKKRINEKFNDFFFNRPRALNSIYLTVCKQNDLIQANSFLFIVLFSSTNFKKIVRISTLYGVSLHFERLQIN